MGIRSLRSLRSQKLMHIKKIYLQLFQNWKILNFSQENLEIVLQKSDAQVGRVNTFHILQTIRKKPSNFKIYMKRPLRFSNF
jgi:hypothetical protein